MKRRREERELIDAVLDDATPNEFREATLEHGLKLVRRQRALRRFSKAVCAVIPLIALATALVWRIQEADSKRAWHQAAEPFAQPSPPRLIAGTSIRILSDEELLELFKDRPVALVGGPDNQRLLFLDETPN